MEGLTNQEVLLSRQQYGTNSVKADESRVFLKIIKTILLEPMFILLLAACIIYFLVQQYQEGIIMLVSIFIVAGISLFQEYRSRNAVQSLRDLSASKATVIRNGKIIPVPGEDIVVGDILSLKEGEIVAADGVIIVANDFSLNESVMTGEAFQVSKTAGETSIVYKGTLVTGGSATVKVTLVGDNTMLGKIGSSLQDMRTGKTPLQLQIRSFVMNMVWVGAVAFLMVIVYNYFQSGSFIQAFLQGLTLAMSILPEEIPVAFSTFQALGAFRLLRNNIIVKQPQFVETLGSATVICADKTGTLTENKMRISFLYDAAEKVSLQTDALHNRASLLIEYAMWASETTAFDPMEKAIHHLYQQTAADDKRPQYRQVHEYPIGGQPPMMTHIFEREGYDLIIAAKGAPEAILKQSYLPENELREVEKQIIAYAKDGYRVLGVGRAGWKNKNWPATQQEFKFEFLGLIAFQDPPKAGIEHTIEAFYKAGIQVKMITGDYAETALAIADKIHLKRAPNILTGQEVLELSDADLEQKVKQVNVFARMFPEAKLKVIKALKENGEIVAMTGDGVNDAPALKAAHIGIAMGQRGSEVAKTAASLILTDDNLGHMVEAVALGRKIYDNLQKAIQYIVSIHIPVILIVTLPLLLSWRFQNIFSPLHVIFLELIMGPTCSIIYENEPMEPGTMERSPRKLGNTFLSGKQLTISIMQGLVITASCLGTGYYFMHLQYEENEVRTIVFLILLFSNIFLTLINRSFHHSVFTTIRYKNNLVLVVIGVTVLFILILLFVPAVQRIFLVCSLPLHLIAICFLAGIAGTFWLEFYKFLKRNRE